MRQQEDDIFKPTFYQLEIDRTHADCRQAQIVKNEYLFSLMSRNILSLRTFWLG